MLAVLAPRSSDVPVCQVYNGVVVVTYLWKVTLNRLLVI